MQLAQRLEESHTLPTEQSMLVRSAVAAEACRAFVNEKTGAAARIIPIQRLDSRPGSEIFMVVFPSTSMPAALEFWQHTGLGISSRFAERYLSLLVTTRGPPGSVSDIVQISPSYPTAKSARDVTSPKQILRNRIVQLITHSNECAIHQGLKSSHLPVGEGDVFLYPTGVTAIWAAHRLLLNIFGARKSVCFGYVLDNNDYPVS